MVKVFTIIGLLLVVAGVPGLYWCSIQNDQMQQTVAISKVRYKHQADEYAQKLAGVSLTTSDSNGADSLSAGDAEKLTPSQLRQNQDERLMADIDDLAEKQKSVSSDADWLYGPGWRQKVADYKDKKQSITSIRVASVTAALAGGVLFVTAFVFLVCRLVVGGFRMMITGSQKTDTLEPAREQMRPVQEKMVIASVPDAPNIPRQTAKSSGPTAEEFRKLLVSQTENLKETVEQLKNLAGAIEQRTAEQDNNLTKRLEKGFKSQTESFKHENNLLKKVTDDIRKAVESQLASQQSAAADVSEKLEQLVNVRLESLRKEVEPIKEIPALLGQKLDEIKNSTNSDNAETMRAYSEGLAKIKQQIGELTQVVNMSVSQKPAMSDISEKFEQLINAQTESLRKEVEPLKEIAGLCDQTLEQIKSIRSSNSSGAQLSQEETSLVRQISEKSLQKSEAIDKSIADLTEQVGAIREYAARQQQRLAKLQDGYDWNLIKNFCLRVIRCIDNLDDRISELSDGNGNVRHLLAVREELIFVLESNGVEQFGAKIDSDYRGLENRLQVLNERDETDDCNLVGRIAQVVRPGYQCRVNDEYTKIVRPAHVRLYSATCLNNAAVRSE